MGRSRAGTKSVVPPPTTLQRPSVRVARQRVALPVPVPSPACHCIEELLSCSSVVNSKALCRLNKLDSQLADSHRAATGLSRAGGPGQVPLTTVHQPASAAGCASLRRAADEAQGQRRWCEFLVRASWEREQKQEPGSNFCAG